MSFAHRDFLGLADYTTAEIRFLIGRALESKKKKPLPSLAGKTLAAIFFNPSLRTRLSFQIAMDRLGGRSILDCRQRTVGNRVPRRRRHGRRHDRARERGGARP